MPNPYDVALRERAVGAYEAGGGSYAEMATAFAIAQRTLERWVACQRDETRVSDDTLNLDSVKDRFDAEHYLSPHSDIVALLVFEHQTHMINLLTRIGWDARMLLSPPRPDAPAILARAAGELVDYLLFAGETPLPAAVTGTSGFAEQFSAGGPPDSRGRSLRQFDLKTRLLRYPCSYMIYSDAFEALPPQARDAIYQRMWNVLTGKDAGPKYARLSAAERRAIVEILRDTKKDLPAYFR